MIDISPSFVILFFFYVAFGNKEIAVIAYASALIHEISHILTAYFSGYKLEKFSAHMCGFCAKFSNFNKIPYYKETIIALSGPFINLLIMIVFSTIGKNVIWSQMAVKINLYLFLVNILPIMPLDGGRVLYAFLHSELPHKKAKKIINITSVSFALFVVFLSVYIGINNTNISFLLASIYILSNISLYDYNYETGNVNVNKVKCFSCIGNVTLAELVMSTGIKEELLVFILNENDEVCGNLTGRQIKKYALENKYEETLDRIINLGGNTNGNGNA